MPEDREFLTVRRRAAQGATMVEYSIVLALIAVVSVAVIGFLGGDVLDMFTRAEVLFDPTP